MFRPKSAHPRAQPVAAAPRLCGSWSNVPTRSACGEVTLIAPAARDARAATLAADQDRAQCPRAQLASIQAAVDDAQLGDTVKVCAGTYAWTHNDCDTDVPASLSCRR
jgi:hypothetical protein